MDFFDDLNEIASDDFDEGEYDPFNEDDLITICKNINTNLDWLWYFIKRNKKEQKGR